jgi:hypothetical protein
MLFLVSVQQTEKDRKVTKATEIKIERASSGKAQTEEPKELTKEELAELAEEVAFSYFLCVLPMIKFFPFFFTLPVRISDHD